MNYTVFLPMRPWYNLSALDLQDSKYDLYLIHQIRKIYVKWIWCSTCHVCNYAPSTFIPYGYTKMRLLWCSLSPNNLFTYRTYRTLDWNSIFVVQNRIHYSISQNSPHTNKKMNPTRFSLDIISTTIYQIINLKLKYLTLA